MTVKARIQGNSLMLTIPADFKVPENTAFEPMIDDNGIISFVPAHKNIYKEYADYDFRAAMAEMHLGDNGELVGKENVW